MSTSSIPAASHPVTVPVPGRHTEIEAWDLSFQVLNHVDNGQNEERTLERHQLTVDFGGGREITYDAESTNLDTALEAIEMIGREIKDWDKAEFDKYANGMDNNWMWFNITNLPNSQIRSDRVTAFKKRRDRTLEYAFPEGKNFKAGPVVIIDDKCLKQLHKLAKLLRGKQDDDAADAKREAEENDFTVSLKQIN